MCRGALSSSNGSTFCHHITRECMYIFKWQLYSHHKLRNSQTHKVHKPHWNTRLVPPQSTTNQRDWFARSTYESDPIIDIVRRETPDFESPKYLNCWWQVLSVWHRICLESKLNYQFAEYRKDIVPILWLFPPHHTTIQLLTTLLEINRRIQWEIGNDLSIQWSW